MGKPTEKDLLEAVKSLTEKVDELSDIGDLEKQFEPPEEKKRSQMLDIDPERTDSFGDSIELMTKTRLDGYGEAFQIAKNFVKREYHNMVGNRYGKHSKLIPVFSEDGTKNKIDMAWFSGNDVKVVEINGAAYYRIRLLVRDILTKKVLLARIPTGGGKSRQEEIDHIGAGRTGQDWLRDRVNTTPMKPISYNPAKKDNINNAGDAVFSEQ